MAPIAILLSCSIGFFAGVVRFAFFDASLLQALATYFAISITLSMVALVTALVSEGSRAVHGEDAQAATLEDWQDWQTEEEMEAARRESQSHNAGKDFGIARKSA